MTTLSAKSDFHHFKDISIRVLTPSDFTVL